MNKTKKKVDKKTLAKAIGYTIMAVGGIAGMCYSAYVVSKLLSVKTSDEYIFTYTSDSGVKLTEFAKLGEQLLASEEFSEVADTTFTHFIAIGKRDT